MQKQPINPLLVALCILFQLCIAPTFRPKIALNDYVHFDAQLSNEFRDRMHTYILGSIFSCRVCCVHENRFTNLVLFQPFDPITPRTFDQLLLGFDFLLPCSFSLNELPRCLLILKSELDADILIIQQVRYRLFNVHLI